MSLEDSKDFNGLMADLWDSDESLIAAMDEVHRGWFVEFANPADLLEFARDTTYPYRDSDDVLEALDRNTKRLKRATARRINSAMWLTAHSWLQVRSEVGRRKLAEDLSGPPKPA